MPFAVPAAVLLVLRGVPSLDVLFLNVHFHLVVVSGIAAAALAIALAAVRAALRTPHHGPVWLAVGCLCVGVLMLSHGLLTPGVLDTPLNLWVARCPYLAIAGFTLGLGLACRPRNAATSRLAIAHPGAVVAVPLAALAALAVWLQVQPTALHGARPFPWEDQATWALSAVSAVVLAVLAVVHWRRWRLGHDIVQYSLVLAASLAVAALVSLRLGELWRLSWWDYHGFLLAGFSGAVYAVWVRSRRNATVEGVLATTFDSDPMTHIVEGYPEALRTLVRAVEVKDSYTHGHSERTARVAVQLGMRLGVDEDLLRVLARGGYLHDVGKISIPDGVLNKRGPLDADERAVIETHPTIGYELVAPVGDLREVLPAIRHHHERWDGTGYPDGLAATEIPLVARIVAVADVWDALTSDRSYRPGWEPARALAHLLAGAGTHFDPLVVEAFIGLAADWGYARPEGDGDVQECLRSAERCHEALASRA